MVTQWVAEPRRAWAIGLPGLGSFHDMLDPCFCLAHSVMTMQRRRRAHTSYVLEQRSLLDGAWCVGPLTCNKSSLLKSVSEVMGGGGLSVVWLFGSLWFMTRPCSLINFNANSVWRDLWPSRTKNDLSYSLAWSCSEAKAECFIFQTADFLFNSPSLETEIKVRHWKMILTFLVAESYLEFKE